MEEITEDVIELDDMFILRLPLEFAQEVRTALRNLKSKKFKKYLSITFDHNGKFIRTGNVKIKKQELHAKLVDLPSIIEAHKCDDKVQLFKTADISQLLICQKEEFDLQETVESNNIIKGTKCKKYLHPHGIAPPLKNVKKCRFRRILKNKEDPEQVADVEKEVLWLLRADNEAIFTKFELCYEDDKLKFATDEHMLFGEVVSD